MSKGLQTVSLREIAKEMGVSVATVSLALRNHPRISEPMRERVHQVAEEMGYKPNPMITSLMAQMRGGRSNEAGSVLGWINNHPNAKVFHRKDSFNHGLLVGARQRAEQLGYRLEEFHLKAVGMTSRRLKQILHTQAIRGVIIPPLPQAKGHLSLNWDEYASVAIGYSMLRPDIHRVSPNHYYNIRLAFRELVHLGRRRIGLALFCNHTRTTNTDDRLDQRWSASTLVHQQTLPAKERVPILKYTDGDEKRFLAWFERHRVEAIVGNTTVPVTMLEAAGYVQGKDFIFVQLDWAPERAEDTVAGVNQRERQVGAAAVDLLTSQINRNETGIPEVPKLIEIPGAWVYRGPEKAKTGNKRRSVK